MNVRTLSVVISGQKLALLDKLVDRGRGWDYGQALGYLLSAGAAYEASTVSMPDAAPWSEDIEILESPAERIPLRTIVNGFLRGMTVTGTLVDYETSGFEEYARVTLTPASLLKLQDEGYTGHNLIRFDPYEIWAA